MLVDRGLLDSVGLQRIGDVGQLGLGDRQVAHHERRGVVFGEGGIAAEGQPGLDRHAVGDHVQV